ncbi:MAG TPA: hypothetical protein VG795_16640 [Acidimicrobiia bacterium]|nr:hypothetical protein [Acidimicrobiia bacterium]
MRAKVAGVVLVASGLFGAVAMTTAPATFQVAARGDHHDNGGHDDHDKGWCIAERESVVGPVCLDVHDVDILSDILNT